MNPFVARRKAGNFSESISSGTQNQITGTLENLYSRIALVDASGYFLNEKFKTALKDVLGLAITTRSSQGGVEAGVYLDENRFVPIQRMGDGVSEIVALLVELCVEKNRIFIIEEPETNLHPQGLKALMKAVRESSAHNQFIISTHSSIVIRELGGMETAKIFQVRRTSELPADPSSVEEIPLETGH